MKLNLFLQREIVHMARMDDGWSNRGLASAFRSVELPGRQKGEAKLDFATEDYSYGAEGAGGPNWVLASAFRSAELSGRQKGEAKLAFATGDCLYGAERAVGPNWV